MGQRLNPFGVLQVVHLVRQDLSIAGKRAGLAGARSGLFMEQVRIVKEMREADKRNGRTGDMVRPRYLVWENVVGAFSSNQGKDFAAVLEEIIKIVEPEAPGIEVPEKGWPTWGGYHDEVGGRWSVVWRTHDAQYWGVPQRRRRISVVADFGGDTASEIQFDRKSVSGDIAESGASWEGFAETAEAGASYAVRIRGGCDGGGKGALVQTEKSGTLGTGNDQTIFCLQGNGIDRADTAGCNGKGWREDTCYTLNTIDSPAVCAEVVCMTPWDAQSQRVYDGNGVSPTLSSRENSGLNREAVLCAGFKAGQGAQAGGIGYSEEVSPTLAAAPSGTNQTPAVVALDMTHACDVIRECGEQVPALQARMGTGGNQVPLIYGIGNGQANEASIMAEEVSQTLNTMHDAQAVMCDDVGHALRAKANCAYREDAETYPVQNMVVRRLTPMECERLQGFPDGWTDIGEWIDEKGKKHKDADSPRYKALGNSIALPFWDWMLRRMARYLPEDATLGSLFDGISGFNVCWSRIHGAEYCRWSSEIEQFPIAVTKKHFGDEKSGETGDWEIFSGGMT
jgi:DNA (cytosine-5)-methyltransferase 1